MSIIGYQAPHKDELCNFCYRDNVFLYCRTSCICLDCAKNAVKELKRIIEERK